MIRHDLSDSRSVRCYISTIFTDCKECENCIRIFVPRWGILRPGELSDRAKRQNLSEKGTIGGRPLGQVLKPIDLGLTLTQVSSSLFLLPPLSHSTACFFRPASLFLLLFLFGVIWVTNPSRWCRIFLGQTAPLSPPPDIINLRNWSIECHPVREYRIPFN